MTHQAKLQQKQIRLLLGGISQASLNRLSKNDPDFPEIEVVGRSHFIDKKAFCEWQSKQAGYLIKEPAQCLNSKALMDYFNKSHTWAWQQVKTGNLPKPFKVGSLNLWFEGEIRSLTQEEVA
jgi:predicted DNA-binding transcriptional regulator AlpA